MRRPYWSSSGSVLVGAGAEGGTKGIPSRASANLSFAGRPGITGRRTVGISGSREKCSKGTHRMPVPGRGRSARAPDLLELRLELAGPVVVRSQLEEALGVLRGFLLVARREASERSPPECVRPARVELDGLPVVRDRAVEVAFLPPGVCAVRPADRDVPLDLERFPVVRDRSIQVALRLPRVPAVVPGLGHARVELGRPPAVRDRSVEVVQDEARATAPVPGRGVALVELESLRVVRDRPCEITRLPAHVPAVDPGGLEPRIELDRLPEVRDRALEVSFSLERHPPVRPRPGVPRLDLERPGVVRERTLEVAP